MQNLPIYKVLNCNKTLFKMFNQQSTFPISVGFKIFKIMKTFNEVEEYVINVMEQTFPNINLSEMNDDEKTMYNLIISEEINLDYERIDASNFESNTKLMLTIEDISNLSIITC